MLWLLIAITILGVALLVLGIRGRAVGTEPRCIGCRFDLTGLDRESSEAVCPECAAPLAQADAIRTGQRLRRRGFIVVGVLLLMPLLGVLVASPSWTAWNPSKPTQILLLDGRFGTSNIRDAAVAELVVRQDAGKLNTQETRSTLSIIAHRISRSSPVNLAHAGRLKRGRDQSLVDDQDWDAVVAAARKQAESWWIDPITIFDDRRQLAVIRDAEGRMIGEEPVPSLISGSPFVSGSVCFLIRLEAVTIDGEDLTLIDNGAWMENRAPGYGWDETPRTRYKLIGDSFSITGRVKIQGDPLPDGVLGVVTQQQVGRGDWEQIPIDPDTHWLGSLDPGSYAMQTRWSIEAYASDQFHVNTRVSQGTLDAEIDLGEFEITTECTLNILQENQDVLALVHDTESVEKAKSHIRYVRAQVGDNWNASGLVMDLMVQANDSSPGTAMVGHLEAQIGNTRIGTNAQMKVSIQPDQFLYSSNGFDEAGFVLDGMPEDVTTCTIIFVPDLDEAVKAAGPWLSEHGTPMPTVAEEIRWENVPIRHPEHEGNEP